jgi:hypothetical protein
MAEDKDQRQALVNTVMNIRVHKRPLISSPAERTLCPKDGLCSRQSASHTTQKLEDRLSSSVRDSASYKRMIVNFKL